MIVSFLLFVKEKNVGIVYKPISDILGTFLQTPLRVGIAR